MDKYKFCQSCALIKLDCLPRYKEAEEDCSKAIALDGTYSKAFARRGTARAALGLLKQAKEGTVDRHPRGYILLVGHMSLATIFCRLGMFLCNYLEQVEVFM